MFSLQNLRIGTKLTALVATCFVGFAAITAVGYSTFNTVRVGGPVYNRIVLSKDLIADVLPPPEYIIEAYLTAHEIESTDAKSPDLDALLTRFDQLEKDFRDRHDYWEQNLPASTMKETLLSAAFKPADQFFAAAHQKLIPAVKSGNATGATEILEKEMKPLYFAHRTAIDEVVKLANADLADSEKQAASVTASSLTMLALIAAGVAASVLAFSYVITRGITKPVASLVASIADMQAKKDLTKRLNLDRKDEVGLLAASFDTFVNDVHSIVKSASATTREVAAAATQIAASAEEMASGMRKQEQQASSVAAAATEMSASVAEVARQSSEARASADESRQRADGGSAVVQQTVAEIMGIADQVQESSKVISNLGKKSEQIGQIIGVINDIADQTNLLALNAAIEAARAGEHGRGFAVVADEVRKLAERTAKATDEVAQSIREIQADTTSAVAQIESGAERVNKGVELATQAGTSLSTIVESSSKVGSMVQSIAAAADQQAGTSNQIAKSVEEINAITRESTEGASQAAQAAAQLSRQAEELQAVVGRFRV
ncbi:MAG: methyl-accepting chemotaxis protein [Phycisphaerales bacterium]|nr:methyl-accepting chemotaxis protein [Phycisphaerales bacterium]